ALGEALGLPRAPQRIEVYDNSHIQGTNAVGAMIVAGAEGFAKNQYRKFNIRSSELAPGDDFGMMREVLSRRFKRLLSEAPRAPVAAAPPVSAAPDVDSLQDASTGAGDSDSDEEDGSPWPGLVVIDGGRGQLSAAQETLAALGVADVPLL